MLMGIDKLPSASKERGQQILNALQSYRQDIEPESFEGYTFSEYIKDPLLKMKGKGQEQIDQRKIKDFESTVKFNKIKEQGQQLGVDTEEFHKFLKGEDIASLRKNFADALKKRMRGLSPKKMGKN